MTGKNEVKPFELTAKSCFDNTRKTMYKHTNQ